MPTKPDCASTMNCPLPMSTPPVVNVEVAVVEVAVKNDDTVSPTTDSAA